MDETAEERPTFTACWVGARAVRRSERGREVMRLVRPRAISPLLRSAPTLTLQLYAAAHFGRLVWFGAGGFGLIEPPSVTRRGSPSASRSRLVRVCFQYWDVVLLAVPAGAALMAALLCALLLQVGTQPFWLFGYAGLFLCLAALCWVAVHLAAGVLGAGISALRILENRQQLSETRAFDLYRQENWTLLLLHAEDPAAVPGVLRAARALIPEAEPLLCVEKGITTGAARAAVGRAGGVTSFDDTLRGILVLRAPGQVALLRPPAGQVEGTAKILGLIAVFLAIYAKLLADTERDDCRPDACEGRPASYLDALTWIVYRVIGQTPSGIDTDSGYGRFVAFLMPLLGLIVLAIVIRAFYEYAKTSKAVEAKIHGEVVKAMEPRTTVLILVAATVERKAVMRRIGARNGGPTARVLAGGLQSVRDLGVVSSCKVRLAQTEQGTVDPGGMTLAAADIVRQVRPDYVILTGICFGLRPGEQSETDLLVATQVECLDWHKEVEGDDGTPRFVTRGDRVATSVVLRDRARLVEDSWTGSKVHFGPIISLNTLVDSRRRTEELRAFKPDAIGGEMEAAGVYAVGARAMTDWIVVKAISDWGYDKTKIHQESAADVAAEFVAELIGSGYLDTPPGELRRPVASS